jgi:hypothetical protein
MPGSKLQFRVTNARKGKVLCPHIGKLILFVSRFHNENGLLQLNF